jgi:hypothetical protein
MWFRLRRTLQRSRISLCTYPDPADVKAMINKENISLAAYKSGEHAKENRMLKNSLLSSLLLENPIKEVLLHSYHCNRA